MKRNFFIFALCLLLSVGMLFVLSACGNDTGKNNPPDNVTVLGSTLDKQGITYMPINNGTAYEAYSISSNSSATRITIPETMHGVPVVSIGDKLFYNYKSLKSVTLPEGIVSIGKAAFSGCTSLQNITIPSSVTKIGDDAFYDCTSLKYKVYDYAQYIGNESNPYLVLIKARSKNISSCEVHADTKFISSMAFHQCTNMKSITVPEGVADIGAYAFFGCTALNSVTIPSSVTRIGGYAFMDCKSLSYHAGDHALYLGNESNPYILLVKAEGKDVTACEISSDTKFIAEWAFHECTSLESIVIPEGVVRIGHSAFSGCTTLASVTVPKSVTEIGDAAFSHCTALKSVTIPDGVTSIGESAFYRCSGLERIALSSSVSEIGVHAFEDCTSLEYITVDAGNARYHASGNCLIETKTKTLVLGCKSSVIPNDESVTCIGTNAFFGSTGLEEIRIPVGVTNIDNYAFTGCTGLKTVVLPETLTNIGHGAFSECTGLESITLPSSLTSIGNSAFYRCLSLESIVIPMNVAQIGDNAFMGCVALSILAEAEELPSGWSSGSFATWNPDPCPVTWGYQKPQTDEG